ncbi:MAG: hypothetical protein Fur0021_14420 [Candidatus Promineifilaceae bacterium]
MSVFAVVLGMMQDAGMPHIGCRCPHCIQGRAAYAACLGLVDARSMPAHVWLIDATPDIKHQLNTLAPWLGPHPSRPHRLRQPDGIFLTHAHMGHISGLPQLGPEGMFVQDLPVYAAAPLLDLLAQTRLWQPLLANLQLRPLAAYQTISLASDLTITPLPVPHRDEVDTGTFAFFVQGPTQSLLYAPDIDNWQRWPEAAHWFQQATVALVDGCFYSRDELGNRPLVAHPLIPDTLAFASRFSARIFLTHLNHTNPALDPASPAHAAIRATHAEIAHMGQVIPLS